ncbi:uncharacterized protein G2W53_040844 [Senna tora]|uniref:Uncharacterized protein n=1 Tax=Senna tora TaxID=362788 RepID=A0A834SGB3_9FABA|nr:uncharacterized protein G2W53_040844 [Senna tora]
MAMAEENDLEKRETLRRNKDQNGYSYSFPSASKV